MDSQFSISKLSKNYNFSYISRPFVISAVIILFVGSIIGSFWMMVLFENRVIMPYINIFDIHKLLQIDGFLTFIIMGIGYMIVPRFRNIHLEHVNIAYLSFFLVVSSLIVDVALNIFSPVAGGASDFIHFFSLILRISGLAVFGIIVFSMLRTRPKLLRLSDYFIGLSVILLIVNNMLYFFSYRNVDPLNLIQLWLLFPLAMIYGIEYKTLPSFLGFIRPRNSLGIISLALVSFSASMGILSIVSGGSIIIYALFNILMLSSSISFSIANNIFWGFDYKKILDQINGEKKARFIYTLKHVRLSFVFLFISFFIGTLFYAFNDYASFLFYDLAIHTLAIGFIGITIALYLPLMLPPITGKMLRFTCFNIYPLVLLTLSLIIRALGDAVLQRLISIPFASSLFDIVFGMSGWLVVCSILLFVIMIHRSMKEKDSLKLNLNYKSKS